MKIRILSITSCTPSLHYSEVLVKALRLTFQFIFLASLPIQPPAINRIFHYFLQPASPAEIVKLYQPIHVISALAFLTLNYEITQKSTP